MALCYFGHFYLVCKISQKLLERETAKFAVSIKEKQDRLPTLYWLPKLHKRPYKARFIANSSSCTTTYLSKLLTSCLTAVKNIGLDTMILFTKGTE